MKRDFLPRGRKSPLIALLLACTGCAREPISVVESTSSAGAAGSQETGGGTAGTEAGAAAGATGESAAGAAVTDMDTTPATGAAGGGGVDAAGGPSVDGVNEDGDSLTTIAIENPPSKVLARLTRQQFLNAVADLLGPEVLAEVGALLPDPIPNVGYANAGSAQNQTYDVIAGFDDAARQVVRNVEDWQPILERHGGCATYACAGDLVSSFASHAFRRPVEPEEVVGLQAIFDAADAEGLEFSTATGLFIRALLQSPDFLYLFEGETLTDYQLATRLAFFLTDAPPDAALLARAADASIQDGAVLAAEADRLLATSGGQFASAFVYDYLGLRRVYQRFVDVDDALLEDMVRSATDTFATWLEEDASVSEVFLTERFVADASVAAFMGLPSADGRVSPGPTHPFRGILTHPATLIAMSNAVEGSTVSRGQFIAHQLLCVPPTPPPDAALIAAGTSAALPPDPTERDHAEARLQEPSCKGCHLQFEPYAFAFNKWGGDGVYHDDPRLDDSGPITTSLGEFEFSGFADFLPLLAESEQFQRCIADHFVRYGLRHTEYGETLVDEVLNTASAGGQSPSLSFRQLAKAVVLSAPFRSH